MEFGVCFYMIYNKQPVLLINDMGVPKPLDIQHKSVNEELKLIHLVYILKFAMTFQTQN